MNYVAMSIEKEDLGFLAEDSGERHETTRDFF